MSEILDFKLPPEQPPAPSPNDLPVTAAGLPPAAPPPQQPAVVSATAAPAPAKKTVKPVQIPKTQGATPAVQDGDQDNDVPDVGNE